MEHNSPEPPMILERELSMGLELLGLIAGYCLGLSTEVNYVR